MLLNWETHEIIATAFGKGRTHDFKLFKYSCTHVHPNIMVLADLGYRGLERLHAHSFLPAKASKHHPLSYGEKRANRTLARLRLHINALSADLKCFVSSQNATVAVVNASVSASTLWPAFITSNSLLTRGFRKRSTIFKYKGCIF